MGKISKFTVYEEHLHVVYTNEVTYSEFINNKAQIAVPKGYRLLAFNRDDRLIHNNFAVFENIVPVRVPVIELENGERISPEFGKPISKRYVQN